MAMIDNTISLLRDADQPLTAKAIYSLTDIGSADLNTLKANWNSIPSERRLLLMQRLGEVSETNFDMNFTTVERLALTDSDDEVRQAAIEALWHDETPQLLRTLSDMAQHDPAEAVRAEAISALGRFILLGELGKLDAATTRRTQDLAINIYNDDDQPIEVRRRAVEAIGNCTREEVPELIQEAYESDEPHLRVSAVFAMGRSCDEDWSSVVLNELQSEDPEMRYEAARAAGELGLQDAVPYMAELLADEDREVMEMAVWALGEIGGGEARHLLEDAIERAEINNDEGLMEAIQEALESASLVGEDLIFDD